MFNFYRKSINAEINVLHMGTCHRKLSKKKKSVTNVKQYFPFNTPTLGTFDKHELPGAGVLPSLWFY